MSLRGVFQPPGDKSISHRIGLFSLLGRGRCLVRGYSDGADCASTLAAVRALGGRVRETPQGLELIGLEGRLVPRARLDCGNSGTTMRLLMGVLAGVAGEYELDGDESLRQRPMERAAAPLRAMGADVQCTQGKPPVRIRGGGLRGMDHVLPAASAQLKSALLLAGLRARGAVTVREPAPSRDHTERMLAQGGADIEFIDHAWRVRPSSFSLPPTFTVPGDPSSAAFFLCGAALIPGSEVTAENMLLNPTRAAFLDVLERMGADITIERQGDEPEPWGRVRVRFGPRLRACRIQAREIPLLVDEAPILALAASQARGTTVFEQVGELRIKETDRLEAIISQLGAMGARLRARGDDLVVEGPAPLTAPAQLESFGDHRIAMTLRMAGLCAGARPLIRREDCAAISYPGFSADLERLWS